MKIAVTYDRETGSVFQHFGRTEFFKIYETENNQIVSVNVYDNAGVGHEALADVLKDLGVDILVCGGMGPGAKAALAQAGLTIYAGITGSADEAVVKLLKGELPQNDAANCDHHDHEHHDHHEEPAAEEAPKEAEEEAEEAPAESEETAEADTDEAEGCDCGEDCGEGCGGGCSGCSGCGPREPIYEGKNAGKTVKVHYRGTLNDGTEFDSSYGRGETLDFMCGMGMMIPGFDKAVVNMEVGEEIDIHLMPEEAYGPVNEESIFTIPIANLAGAEDLEVGNRIYISGGGRPFPVTVTAKDAETITLDANHALAGQELNFHIQLVAVE